MCQLFSFFNNICPNFLSDILYISVRICKTKKKKRLANKCFDIMLCYFMQLALKMCKFLHNACQTEVMFMNVIIELITRGRWVQNFSSFW